MFVLTNQQQNFLDVEGRIILCACPGSGKTFIVSRKLHKYLESWSYLHRGVAILSFTNVASDEVSRQIAIQSKKPFLNIGYPHFIGTLDSFINTFILLRFGYLMQQQNRKRPQIINESYNTISFKAKESICYKQRCPQNPHLFHWSSNGLLRDNKPINCTVKNKPCINFKKSLIKRGLVSQREVAALSLKLIKKYPQIAAELAYRYPVIIVDEAQDTSREQIEILNILGEAGVHTLILVGDPDQAIYEWRDATPEYFIDKINDPNWNTLYLTENFRSSQNICNATSLFSSVLSNKQPAIAQGEHSTCPIKPILLQVNKNKNRDDIIHKFKSLCEDYKIEITSNNISVLTRGRIHLDTNIENLWQTTETLSLSRASYLWHCASRKEAFQLCEKVLYDLEFGNSELLTLDEMKKAIELRMDYTLWKAKVIAIIQCLPSPNTTLMDWKQQLINNLNNLIKENVIVLRNNMKVNEVIKIKTRDKKYPHFLKRPLIDYFEKRSTSDITLSSVHGVKGETFEATLLIVDSVKGANALTPTVLNTASLNSELIRIAYVAMTRPSRLLVVSIPKSTKTLERFPPSFWDYQEL